VLKSQEKLLENVRPLLGKNVGQAMQGGFHEKFRKEDSLQYFTLYIYYIIPHITVWGSCFSLVYIYYIIL
jgi:hypothetical protein